MMSSAKFVKNMTVFKEIVKRKLEEELPKPKRRRLNLVYKDRDAEVDQLADLITNLDVTKHQEPKVFDETAGEEYNNNINNDLSNMSNAMMKSILDSTLALVEEECFYPEGSFVKPIRVVPAYNNPRLNARVLNRTRNLTPHEDIIPGLRDPAYTEHIIRTLRDNFVYDVDKDFIDEIVNTWINIGIYEKIQMSPVMSAMMSTIYRNTSEFIYDNTYLGNIPNGILSRMESLLDDLMDTVLTGNKMSYKEYKERVKFAKTKPFQYRFAQTYYKE